MNAARSALAFQAAQEKERLKRQIKEERRNLKREPKLVWREWLKKEVEEGNELAESALRGLRYREMPENREDQPLGYIAGLDKTEKYQPKSILDLGFRIKGNGVVEYRWKDKRTAFVDQGRQIAIFDTSDEGIKAALQVAQEKWKSGIEISGSKEFKEKHSR